MKKLKEKNQKELSISYCCRKCNKEENIPVNVIEYFDLMDTGDPSVPPRFSCESCGGEMWPKEDWMTLVKRLNLPY